MTAGKAPLETNADGGAPTATAEEAPNETRHLSQTPDQVPSGAAPHYPYPSPAAGPGPTPHHQQTGQAVGAIAGGALGEASGDGLVGGMITGGVVGGMIGQRIAQAEKHEYWRGQSQDYRAALAAGQPPLSGAVGTSPDGTPKKFSWWSKEGREQRRLKRWERRAERRDGTNINK